MASHRFKRRTAVLRVKVFTACLLLLALFRSSMAVFYTHEPSNARYFTESCKPPGIKWCGEQWRASTILYYNYTVSDTLVLKNETTVDHRSNCSGTQNSLECEPSTSTTTHTVKPVRVKTVKRSSTPEVIKLPKSLSLGLILTDNINVTGGLVQEKYPKNQDKIWQIRIPPNCRMNIYFSEFLIESSDTCSKDYFSVQTSKNQQDIPRYCDTLHRIEIRNRRRVQLYFHTDDSVEKRGIIASVCLSNWPETGDNQLPCTCTSGRRRRSARSEESSYSQREYRHQMRKRIALEDEKVGKWLTELMQGGLDTVDRFLENPENPGQRYLAEQYMQALGSYELQDSIL